MFPPLRGSDCYALLDRCHVTRLSSHHQAEASFFSLLVTLDFDFHIAAERAHEAEQSLKRESFKASAQQIGNVALANAHCLGRSLLGKPGLLDQLIDADNETSFEHVLISVGQSEVGEDVAAAADNLFYAHLLSLRARLIQSSISIWVAAEPTSSTTSLRQLPRWCRSNAAARRSSPSLPRDR